MKKLIVYITLVFVSIFIVFQFFQPEKNENETMVTHIFKTEQIPENVKKILESSCMDCHSNKTTYLWYDKVSPVSWMVNKHIIKGKKELNFSEWGDLDAFDKYSALKDMLKEIEKKNMPLSSYAMMHKNARLSDEERKALIDWCNARVKELAEELK